MSRKMKDSGIEWIGEIPEEWDVVRLRFLCDITTGNKDTIDNEPDGKYPFFVRSPIIERISSFSYDGEAILTAGDGVGAGKVFHHINGKFDFHQRVYNLHNFKHIHGRYLYYYMKESFVKEIEQSNAKSTVDSIRLYMLKNFPILLFNYADQKNISDFLDKKVAEIDHILKKTRESIEEYKKYKQSIITETVTKGLNPDVKMKDSGIEWIGEIPEHWDVKKLKYLTKLNERSLTEKTEEDYLFKYIDIGSVSFDKGVERFEEMTFQNAPSRARRMVRKGDIIISTVRTYLKAIAAIEDDANIIVSTGFAVLSPVKVEHKYLEYICKSSYFVSTIEAKSYGVSYPAINALEILEQKVAFPTILEQKEIVNYLDNKIESMNVLIEQKELLLSNLESYKKSLIYECVTGKREVV